MFLKKIAIALDQIQLDSCNIGEVTRMWLELKLFFELEVNNSSLVDDFNFRFSLAIAEYHQLTY